VFFSLDPLKIYGVNMRGISFIHAGFFGRWRGTDTFLDEIYAPFVECEYRISSSMPHPLSSVQTFKLCKQYRPPLGNLNPLLTRFLFYTAAQHTDTLIPR